MRSAGRTSTGALDSDRCLSGCSASGGSAIRHSSTALPRIERSLRPMNSHAERFTSMTRPLRATMTGVGMAWMAACQPNFVGLLISVCAVRCAGMPAQRLLPSKPPDRQQPEREGKRKAGQDAAGADRNQRVQPHPGRDVERPYPRPATERQCRQQHGAGGREPARARPERRRDEEPWRAGHPISTTSRAAQARYWRATLDSAAIGWRASP